MSVRLNWISFVLSIVAILGVAGSASSDSWQTVSSIKSNIISQVSQEFSSYSNSLPGSSFESEHQRHDSDLSGLSLLATTVPFEFSSDQLPLVPARASATLFRDNLQTKPVYWLIAEFNPPDLASFLFSDPSFKLNHSPWYTQSDSKSSGRLSGWKDGSTLYTASITYY